MEDELVLDENEGFGASRDIRGRRDVQYMGGEHSDDQGYYEDTDVD